VLLEKNHPKFTSYVEDTYSNKHVVSDADLDMYDNAVSLPMREMDMRATLLEKDDLSRRKAQGFKTYVKHQMERS